MAKKIILAITGASGSLYAVEFLRLMAELEVEVHGVISNAGRQVLEIELGLSPEQLPPCRWFAIDNFAAPMASGSSLYDAMAVLPCTMGTLSAIANGSSINLIHRAADVCLKERRPLVLSVRETPFNQVHIENMLRADRAGAIICPAMPAFYHKPRTIDDLARDYAARVASLLGLQVPAMKHWGGVGAGSLPEDEQC
jgi:4-hydroxy-3-polyprenylbenzoate decarboxylase